MFGKEKGGTKESEEKEGVGEQSEGEGKLSYEALLIFTKFYVAFGLWRTVLAPSCV